MKWYSPVTALAVLLLCAGNSALAGTITANYVANFTVNGLPTQADTVSFTFNATNYNNVVGAELAGIRVDLPTDPGEDTLVTMQPFFAYCAELNENIVVNANVTHDNVVMIPSAVTANKGDPDDNPVVFDPVGFQRTLMLGRLWGTFHPTVANTFDAAAFQLAVWEICWDTDMTLGGPGLFTSGDAHAAQAEFWLAIVRNLGNTLATNKMLLITDASHQLQDLVTPSSDPSFSSPEPSSVVLAALAMVGLGAYRFRRSRKLAS